MRYLFWSLFGKIPNFRKITLKIGISLWSIGDTFLLRKVGGRGAGAVSHDLTLKMYLFFEFKPEE